EPEVELRRAGVTVHRTVLREPFRLDPDRVPSDADLVVVGNPTNPTSVLHPRRDVAALCRPGRVTVVDEAFLDVVDDEPGHTLAGSDLPGLVVLRSLTKTWALAGLRVGYAVGDPALLSDLAAQRPHWPLGTLQLEAVLACVGAVGELRVIRDEVAAERAAMVRALERAGIAVVVPPEAPFVLVRTPRGADPLEFRTGLAARGIATRRCDTFPGLDSRYLRLAVRPGTMVGGLVDAWRGVAEGERWPPDGPPSRSSRRAWPGRIRPQRRRPRPAWRWSPARPTRRLGTSSWRPPRRRRWWTTGWSPRRTSSACTTRSS